MRERCLNPNSDGYHNYGGRGITIDPRWNDFKTFLEDMGERRPGTTLDRKDVDGPYTKENCRWASPTVQARGQRRSVNLTFHGQTKHWLDWCEQLGLNTGTVMSRIKAGKTIEEVLSTTRLPGPEPKPRKPRPKPPSIVTRITYQGITRTITKWARVYGVPLYVLKPRLLSGMDFGEALKKSIDPKEL